MSILISALITATLLSSSSGQNEPQETSELPDVVVEGRIPESLAREFIDEVAASPRGATVARWNRPVCVGVVNLTRDTAQYLIDRVSLLGSDFGLEIEQPGCEPVVVIVGTRDGQAVAQGLVDRRLNVLAPGNAIESGTRRELAAFANVDRPVRWWHVSTAVDPVTGRSVVRNQGEDNFVARNAQEFLENVPAHQGAQSLIRASFRQDLRRALIIIDFDEIGDDIDFDQLADYVAFVAFAQVDPEADTSGFSTILNLFDDPTTPGLTEWDRAYLWGLYNSDDTARGDAGREAALRREMLRAREQGAADAPEAD